jgi:hypothetical protein
LNKLAKIGAVLAAVAVAAAVPLFSPSGSMPQASAQTIDTGSIMFQDNFDGSAGQTFDHTKWGDYSSCAYRASAAFGNIQCGDNETLDGQGHLIIPATPSAGSAIRTGANFGFTTGVMSAYIKLPAEGGYWPAFWAVNDTPEGTIDGSPTTPAGEIDAMESYTQYSNIYHASTKTWAGDQSSSNGDNRCPQPETTDLTQFHKYSVKVEPGVVTAYFDDVQCGTQYLKDPTKPWGYVPDVTRANWLILDLAVGGCGGCQAAATENAQMVVDWVTVRSLTPDPGGVLVNGAQYEFKNTCAGKVAEVPNNSTAINTALKSATWNGSATQKWIANDMGSGYYQFVNANSHLQMVVQNASSADGAKVIQYTLGAGANEQWKVVDLGGGVYRVLVKQTNKALDIAGNGQSNGLAIDQKTVNTSCNEKWNLVKL